MKMHARWAPVLLAFSLLSGCGSSEVSGAWCGKDVTDATACLGDDVFYAKFEQSGESVSGTWCEDYNDSNCESFTGTITDDTVTLANFFKDDRPPLVLTLDGDTLSGVIGGCSTCDSGPCLCDIPVTLHRLDD